MVHILVSDLGLSVRQRPLLYAGVCGDRHSVGHSAQLRGSNAGLSVNGHPADSEPWPAKERGQGSGDGRGGVDPTEGVTKLGPMWVQLVVVGVLVWVDRRGCQEGVALAPNMFVECDAPRGSRCQVSRSDYQGCPIIGLMRLLSLDYDPVYKDAATRASFSSDVSAFDHDVVIWDPAASFREYTLWAELYQGLPSLPDSLSVTIRADVARRRAEFLEFIDSGRILMVFVRPPQQCYIDTGERTYSGTCPDRVTTTPLAKFDLLTALPVADCGFTRASGTRIAFDGDGPIVTLLRKYTDKLTYQAVMLNPPGAVVARVAGTNRIVSSIMRSRGGGYLILLPTINLEAELDEDDDDLFGAPSWLPEAPEFQADLLTAIEQLSGSKTMSRPIWAEQYATDQQLLLRAEIVKQQGRVESARAKLAKLHRDKEQAESKDQLFLGTGRALELEVKRVLELLGGTVAEPEPGRDDWKVSFPEGEAVVEVKGVTKSAAEKHAAQLEKWVSAEMEKSGKPPKGILVVNTWREMPPDKRQAEDFPKQMLSYCESREHCLVTGLQLFVIQNHIERDPTRAEYWRRQIMKTSGPISGCEDWKSVIHLSKATT